MNKILFSVLIFKLMTFSAYAEGEVGATSRALKCVRSIVENQIGGVEGLEASARFLEEIYISRHNRSELRSIRRECREYRRSNEESELPYWKLKRELDNIHFDRNFDRALLANFLDPRLVCNGAAVEVGASVVVGGKISLGLGTCKGTNGRYYKALIGNVALTVGLNIKASLNSIDDLHYFPRSGYLAIDDPGIFDLGIGLNLTLDHDNGLIGVGVGAGVSMLIDEDVYSKVLTIRTGGHMRSIAREFFDAPFHNFL